MLCIDSALNVGGGRRGGKAEMGSGVRVTDRETQGWREPMKSNGGVLRSDSGLTWVAGGRTGVKDMGRRVRGTEREVDSRGEEMNKAWMESGIEHDAQLGERGKRIKASWRRI